MAKAMVAPTGSSIWKTPADISRQILTLLRRQRPRSISQAASLWRKSAAKVGAAAAQRDRPLMRRGRVF